MNLIRQTYAGKTLARILFNSQVAQNCSQICGRVLDLASGGHSDYKSYLPESIELVKSDAFVSDGAGLIVDFNEKLPFRDGEFDAVLFFNALYIAENRIATLTEIRRILKRGGSLFLSSPLIYGEIPEPVDYCRLTYQGLDKEFRQAGYSKIQIARYGERFSAAVVLMHPFFVFNSIRLIAYALSLVLDTLIPGKFKARHPAPCGYFCVVSE